MRSGIPDRYRSRRLVIALLLLAGSSYVHGQTYNLGRTPSEDEISARDIAISPDGRELPEGGGSAVEGAGLYAAKCAVCHGPTGEEPFAWSTRPRPWTVEMYSNFPPPLVGGLDTLDGLHPIKTVGSFWPYAPTIWDYINRGMPPNIHFRGFPGTQMIPANFNPEPLSANEVYAITAFLLYRNGIIAETEVMDKESLPAVRMPNRDGFLPVDPENYTPVNQFERHVAD